MPFSGQVLGIEGTAWNLSAALFSDHLCALESDPYRPPTGGIHPREAAQHHASVAAGVIGKVLMGATDLQGIAFSQGPGLGPCLRTVATAARALAVARNLPLIGVNHCVAHVEIGRYATGCDDPIVLYASGANTQVIGYLNSRYRIFGETLDIGIGNALDKFARSKNLPHPGGPLIEKLASQGSFIDLPYTVKGMDLAFSGLVSAAKESRAPLEDVCYSLQETAFAMCVEVTERALAQTGKDEVLLVGGVGANCRLQQMLETMCEDRGASFHVPENTFLGDNGAMIAYTGRLMLVHGEALPVCESTVNPNFRSDEVTVTWRSEGKQHPTAGPTTQGAEAIVTLNGREAIKCRTSKRYRMAGLDHRLLTERTRAEAKLLVQARSAGVSTPVIRDITQDTIVMEQIEGVQLKEALSWENLQRAGEAVGRLHTAGIVHGDLTTSNLFIRDRQCVLIDFGLAHATHEIESRGVDLHVLFQTLQSTTSEAMSLRAAFIEGYTRTFDEAARAVAREEEIIQRGRYQ